MQKNLLLIFSFVALAISAYVIVPDAEYALADERQVPQSHQQVQLSYSPVVKKAAPAVVNIYTKRKVRYQSPFAPFLNDPIMGQLLQRHFPPGLGRAQERIVRSLGSGVIVHPSGIVVTSAHVVDRSDEIIAVLSDEREFPARLIVADSEHDLAVLKLDTTDTTFPYLQTVGSESLEVGDLVLAIGNPFGIGQTVTSGIVSAMVQPKGELSQKLPGAKALIQTDAAINPGNSGGALVDMQGRLVGINTAIYSKSGGSHGIGFAIPSDFIQPILDELLS